MNIKLRDNRERSYTLIPKSKSASASKSGAPPIHSPHETREFLNSINASAPSFWQKIWKQINAGSGNTSVLADRQIIEDIAKKLKSGEWLIVADKSTASASRSNKTSRDYHHGSTGGSSDAGTASSTRNEAPVLEPLNARDRPISEQPAPSSDPAPGEEKAIKKATPTKVSKDSPTAVVRNKDEKTNGCPISMVSGEEVLPLTDFTLPGPVPFIWKRFYRTGHSRDCGLGHGWTHTACEYLYLEETQVVLSDDEGRELRFARPALYQRSKLINEGLNLDFEGRNSFVLKQTGQPDKVFSRLGEGSRFRLTQIRHADYRPLRSYSRGETDPAEGFCIDLHYNASNQLSRILGNWGKGLKFSRNAQGRIACVEQVSEADSFKKNGIRKTAAKRVVAEYEYSDVGDLIAQRNGSGKGERYQYSNHIFTQRTLVTGFSYYYEWDRLDNQARCLRNWGDQGIYNYHFKWDPDNNTSTATDSRGYTTAYVYNEFGEIVEERDPEGGVHRYQYNRGRKIAHTDPEGHTTKYQYDNENRFHIARDALNNYQAVHYFLGQPTEFKDKDNALWKRDYALNGRLRSMTDPMGRVTQYKHYNNGLLKAVTDPEGRATHYHWNTRGELIRITDFEGNQQQLKYNAFGQIIERHVIIKPSEDDTAEPDITRYSYTLTGQLEKVIAANGDITNYQFNDNEQLIRHSDPQGRITCFEYDGLSQVVKRINANGFELTYQYDKERNLTGLINENGEIYRFEYDGCERLIKETGFDGRIQKYTYNKAGHLIQHQDGSSVITDYERDAIGQMVTKACRDTENKHPEERSRYQYDPKGRVIETYNRHQWLKFEFDLLGNLIKENHGDINDRNQIIDASRAEIAYGIQWPDKRRQIQLPDGQKIDYIYGADKNKALEKIQFNGESITEIHRDRLGRETLRAQGDMATQTEYDPMGRLQKQQAFNLERKQAIIQREYAYDSFGNLSQLTDGNSEARYIYDLLDRLEKTEGTQEETFDFDPAGNIVGINEPRIKGEKKQAKGNRLVMQGDKKFTYDARGNLVKECRGKEGKLKTEFEYNLQNQLIKVIKDNQITEYKYDPLGRRIEKKDAFGSTGYLWAGDQLAQESRNNIKKTYVYEPLSFKPVALIQDKEVYHYHLDHLGTPRELSNNQGDIVWKVHYKTYGNVAIQECEEIENNLRFQGQYFDEETGLHYNRHRYYHPSTGQFISQDPIGLRGGVNNYQYAPNPVGWVDPFGLCKEANDYGDLTSGEILEIQDIVNTVGSPLYVVGSAAKKTRRNIGSNFPLGKGEDKKSDIDYIATSLEAKQEFDDINLPDIDPSHGVIKRRNGPKTNAPSILFKPKN